MVFQFVHSGTTFTVAMSAGVSGWVLLAQSAAGADQAEIQAALDYVNVLGFGEVIISHGRYVATDTITVYDNTTFSGMGMEVTEIVSSGFGSDLISMDGWYITIRDMTIDTQTNNGRACVSSDVAAGYGTSYSMLFNLKLLGGTTVATIFWPNAIAFQGPGAVDAEELVPFNSIIHCHVESERNGDVVNFTHQYQGLILVSTFKGRVIINRNRGTVVDGNKFWGPQVSNHALEADGPTWYCTISNNTFRQVTGDSIYLPEKQFNATWYYVQGISIVGNTVENGEGHGFHIGTGDQAGYVRDITVSGNTINTVGEAGIRIDGAQHVSVDGNTVIDPNGNNSPRIAGIQVQGDHNTVSDNVVVDRRVTPLMDYGIGIGKRDTHSASYNHVTGNYVDGSDRNGITISDDGSAASLYNHVVDNYIINTDEEAILEEDRGGGTDYNFILRNRFLNIGSAPSLVTITGANTVIHTREIQLMQGTSFISTAGEAWGWSITADTNFALGVGWLPLEVQQVVRIRVIGVALAAPGAGDYMRIQITGDGGTFAEDFATEPIDVVDHNNEEVTVQVDEPVNWIFTASDDADIGHLLGGDRLQIKVLHEGAGNGDAETNAIVDTLQIEFV